MARLDLDLSPTRPRVPLVSWLLLVAGALATGFAALQFQTASAERGREARELRTLETSLSEPATGSGTSAAIQEARSARATVAALRELQVPWASLFVALESVAGRNVALLSIEPSAQRQEVRITAEAKNSGGHARLSRRAARAARCARSCCCHTRFRRKRPVRPSGSRRARSGLRHERPPELGEDPAGAGRASCSSGSELSG